MAVADQIVRNDVANVEEVCKCLSISRSVYYEHQSSQSTRRDSQAANLTPLVMDVFWKHRRRYGARRIVEELRDTGLTVCRRTVANIMKSQGLRAIQPKSFKPKTTESRHRLGYNPNLLLDDFQLTGINKLWVADITYIPLEGKRFVYLAMLMDRFSRRLIGWHLDMTMTEDIVLTTVSRAITSGRPTNNFDPSQRPRRPIRRETVS